VLETPEGGEDIVEVGGEDHLITEIGDFNHCIAFFLGHKEPYHSCGLAGLYGILNNCREDSLQLFIIGNNRGKLLVYFYKGAKALAVKFQFRFFHSVQDGTAYVNFFPFQVDLPSRKEKILIQMVNAPLLQLCQFFYILYDFLLPGRQFRHALFVKSHAFFYDPVLCYLHLFPEIDGDRIVGFMDLFRGTLEIGELLVHDQVIK